MNSNAVDDSGHILKWILPAAGSAIIAAAACYIALFWFAWEVQPSWVSVAIPVVPLAIGSLLLLPADRLLKAIPVARGVLALHAGFMAAMLAKGLWYPIPGTCLFIDLLLLAALHKQGASLKRFSKCMIFWVALAFGVGLPLTVLNVIVVIDQAEAIAGDRQYCIQYASQTDGLRYEPALTLLELSPIYMQSRLTGNGNGVVYYHFQNHAVLVIDGLGKEFLNWSYMRETFVDEVLNRQLFKHNPSLSYYAPRVVCKPEVHYARRLPIW